MHGNEPWMIDLVGAGIPFAAAPVPIPGGPSVQGVSLFFQWGALAPNGRLLGGISLSDALHVHIY